MNAAPIRKVAQPGALVVPAALAALVLVPILLAACSSRVETPVAGADSTVVFAPRDPDGVVAEITLYRKRSKKSGKLLGAGQTFTVGEKSKVRARIDLANVPEAGRDLMFHVVWLGPGSREFYTKEIDWSPGDGDASISSSISIPPDRREPGDYALQVYLFRELIAEKRFELLAPEGAVSTD